MPRPLHVLVAAAVLLAGCSDAPATGADGASAVGGSACDPKVDIQACAGEGVLTADSEVRAPTWSIGQWWEWQPADADGPGSKFKSVVVDAGASGAKVGTDSLDRAKQQAAFDHILIGDISPSLGATAWGGQWDLLSFPLTNGKTWSTTIPNIAWDIYGEEVQLDMRADFDADLQGFTFMGHAEDAMVLEGTYLPATGWYGSLVIYDVDPEQEPLEFSFTATASGLNHTGAAHTATAEPLLMLDDANGFTDFPTEGGEPITQQPQPHGTFTMAADTHLYGVIVAISVAGSRVVTLTDPANQQRQVVATGAPEDEQALWLDEAGAAGQWTVATSGAGGLSRAIVELYQVTVTTTEL